MIENKKILIVDDDQEIRSLLAEFLGNYSYTIIQAVDGKCMFSALNENRIDLIILDVMLPGDDGITLCRELRRTSDIPIIMLTAVGEETDKIIGLEVGADDYLSKPFNPRELLARMKAIFRRVESIASVLPKVEEKSQTNVVSFSDWLFDLDKRQLFSPEKLEVCLTSAEYDLLVAFVKHPQRVLSRDQLLDFTKSRQAGPFDRSIDVLISRLRQKLESNPKEPVIIKTVRGGGYLFTSEVRCSIEVEV